MSTSQEAQPLEVIGIKQGSDIDDIPEEIEGEELPGVQIGPGTEQVKEEQADENVGIELGDLVEFHSNRADIETVKGRVYYIDDTRVSILEEGKSRKLVVFDMEEDEEGDVNFLAEYELTGAEIQEKRLLPSFVAQRGMAKDMIVETFTADGEALQKYMITTVDEVKDSVELVAVDETMKPMEDAEPLILDFAFQGIPRDRSVAPFDVLRVIEPPKKEETVPNDAAKGEVEEEFLDFEFLEDLEAPDVEEGGVAGLYAATEKPVWDRIYDTDQQVNDMLRERISDLDPTEQRNPRYIRAVTRHVWNMLSLRNDVTRYSGTKPVGRKPVAFNTLVELLERTEFPLAKKVLSVSKAIYVDHKYKEVKRGTLTVYIHEDPSTVPEPQIVLNYLEDSVMKGNRYIETQLKDSSFTDVPAAGQKIPRWITVWQGYFNKYFVVFNPKSEKDDVKDIKYDQDFFRDDIPQESSKSSNIVGLPILNSDRDTIVTADSINKITYSFGRAIGARYGRYGEGGRTHKVEDADNAEIKGYLIFPLEFIRDLGYIRSGILLLDSVFAMQKPTPMYKILQNAGGVTDIPESNRIISVNFDGSNLGNTEVADWLKGQAIYGGGIGDLMPYLRSFGLLEAEFTVQQKKVLDSKCDVYRGAVKKHLKGARDRIKELREARKPIQTYNLLENQRFFELIKRITDPTSGEPILQQMVEDFKLRHPSYWKFDVATFAYLFVYYPDLLINSLAQNPDVARERLRAERDIFIRGVLDKLAGEKKLQDAGQQPVINPCQHVKDLKKIRSIADDGERMRALNKFIQIYKLKKENHWLWCNNGTPPHHLICEHEYLLLQEYLRPKEKDVIHKEIILNFSGGKFNGKYICKQCGQAIMDYDYDTSLEYDDQGKPMVGRSELTEEDQEEIVKLESILSGQVEDQEEKEQEKKVTQTEDDKIIFGTINKLASLVGVFPDFQSYIKMIARVKNELALIPDRAKYAASQKIKKQAGKASTDYDVFKNRVLVSLCGAALLINIQTHIPEYVIRYTLAGCSNPTFTGYPRDPDVSKPDIGMEYIACAISSVTERVEPWDITGYQSIQSSTERLKEIMYYLKIFTIKLAESTDVQQSIIDKKQYLLETFGYETALGRPQDMIPYGFTPAPYNPSKELKAEAEEPVIPESASEAEKVRAYIKQAHMYALKYGKYTEGVSFSEASCCYNELLKPADFWISKGDLPKLAPREPPRGTKGSLLFVKMTPRPLERLFGQADASIMYRLFLRVCFRGPRTGQQHEPGYDNICPWCDFKFPDDPRNPPPTLRYAKEGSKQKKYDAEYESEVKAKEARELQALREAGIDQVKKDNFEELLINVNKQSLLPETKRAEVPTPMENLRGMLSILPAPFEEYDQTLRATLAALEALPKDATKRDILNCFTELSTKAVSLEKEIRDRLGDETYVLYEQFMKLPPQELGEALRSYFLIPFQRVLTNTENAQIKDFQFTLKPTTTTEFSYEVYVDMNKSYGLHTSYLNEISSDIPKNDTFIRPKIREVVNKLSIVIPVFIKILRPTILRGGAIASSFLQRAIVAGIFAEFIMPNHLPPNETGVVAPVQVIKTGIKIPPKILQACLFKYKSEGLAYSQEQIRELITDRMEKEKMKIVRDKETMTPEERKLDNMLQKLGMGKWAVGGSASIRQFDPNQYVSEAQAMEEAGITRFAEQVDVYEREGGYDVEQTDADNA